MALTKWAKEFLYKRRKGNRITRTKPKNGSLWASGASFGIPKDKTIYNISLPKKKGIPIRRKRGIKLDSVARGRYQK